MIFSRISFGSLAKFALLTTFLGATTASAYSTGQVNLSGKIPTESCLNCHGTDSYDGVKIEVSGTTSSCFNLDGSELIYAAPGTTLDVTITVDKPADGILACPVEDCCGDAAPALDAACMTRPVVDCDAPSYESCCFPIIKNCDVPQVGFNLEATSGTFSSEDPGVRLAEIAGESFLSQTTHVVPKEFDDATSVTWSMKFTTPTAEELAASKTDYNALKAENTGMLELIDGTVAFYLGATVGNGNFTNDSDDLNANAGYVIGVSGDEIPAFCAVCSDGSLPDSAGTCPATCSSCSVDNTSKWPLGLATFTMLGLLSLRRRRR